MRRRDDQEMTAYVISEVEILDEIDGQRYRERVRVGLLGGVDSAGGGLFAYCGRGSQRKRRMATAAPMTPQASSTARCGQSKPVCWANGPSSASLNGRTGSTPAMWFSTLEWI